MFARRLLRPALAAAAVVLFQASAPAHAAENLLVNPDFELGLEGHAWMPAGWDTTGAGLPTVFFGRDNALAHSGKFSVSVANASGVWPIEHGWHQSLLVGPKDWGKDLALSIWTRSIGIDGRAYVVLQALRDSVGKMARIWKVDRDAAERRLGMTRIDDQAYDLGWQRINFSDAETDWVKREMRIYIAPGTTVVTVRAGVLGVGQLYLDDASLTWEEPLPAVAPEPGVNLIANAGFEGDFNVWEVSKPPFPNLKVEPVTSPAHSGEKSLLLQGEGGLVTGRAGAAQVLCNRALAGKRLRLSAYAKSESLLTSGFVRLYCHGTSGIAQEVSLVTIEGTRDWTKLETELDVPEDTYSIWAWMAYTAPSKGRIWFDDMTLEVVGPSREKASAGKP
jgi:hypothetical protein